MYVSELHIGEHDWFNSTRVGWHSMGGPVEPSQISSAIQPGFQIQIQPGVQTSKSTANQSRETLASALAKSREEPWTASQVLKFEFGKR